MTLFKPKIIAGLILTALVFRGTDSVLVLLVFLRPRTSTSSTKNLEMTIVYLIFRRFFGFVGCLGYGYIEFVNLLVKSGITYIYYFLCNWDFIPFISFLPR